MQIDGVHRERRVELTVDHGLDDPSDAVADANPQSDQTNRLD